MLPPITPADRAQLSMKIVRHTPTAVTENLGTALFVQVQKI
jgi:hypothetical protein